MLNLSFKVHAKAAEEDVCAQRRHFEATHESVAAAEKDIVAAGG
jgi:hypothetical protein